MKKSLVVLVPALVLAAIGATSDADAQPQLKPGVVVNPGVLRFASTAVKGTITLPATSGPLTGFGCGNVSVYAESVARNPPPPGGGFTSAKWTRHGTGTPSGGTCAYTMNVPAGQAFHLSLNGAGSFNCDVIVPLTNSATGPFTVPYGQTQEHDFAVSNVLCEVLK